MVHPIFHVSLLKKCLAPNVVCQPLPMGLTKDWELRVQPLEVLAVRRNGHGELEVLIKWLDMPEFESTWELAEDIKINFPDFHLDDKAVVQERGIVRDRVPEGIKVYEEEVQGQGRECREFSCWCQVGLMRPN